MAALDLHSSENSMHRASYFAKHVLPYMLLILSVIALCIVFRRRCLCSILTANEERSGGNRVDGKNSVVFVGGGDSLLE